MHDDMMITKECFFFDAGNTLIRLHPSREELLMGILQERELRPSFGQVKVAFILNDHQREIDGFTLLTLEERQKFWERYTESLIETMGLEVEDIEELSDSLARAFRSTKNWVPFQDVIPTLEKLRSSGCTLAVISNAEQCLKCVLEEHQIARFFKTIVISEDVGVEKPDPAIFQEALLRVGIDPKSCVHTGDSMETDVEGAKRAGITPVWLDRQSLGKHIPDTLRIRRLPDLLTMFRLPDDWR